MRGSWALSFFTVFLALCVGEKPTKASGFHRIAVQVTCACQDSGGKAYLQAIHEELANSAIFREVATNETPDGNTVHINIVSAAKGTPTMAKTGLTVICLLNGEAVLDQEVEICNRYPMKMFAQAMLESLKVD